MKKKLLLLLSIPFLLTSCQSPKENSDNSNEEPISESQSSDSETHVEGERLAIGDYGDYVSCVDGSKDAEQLKNEYDSLTEKVTDTANGVIQSSYERGLLEFFDIHNKVEISVNISNEELAKLNQDHYENNKESFRECSVDIYLRGLKFHYEGVGIRQKGNTSRGEILSDDYINLRHYKLSFEETFDDEWTKTPKAWDDEDAKAYREDRSFFGLSKIDFRWNRNLDSTYIREYYAFEMYRMNGGVSARTNPVHFMMNIDGQEYNMGVYLAVETLSKSFIKRNFIKNSRNGDLYKLSWGSGDGARFNPVDDRFFGVETQHRDGDYFYQNTYTYDLKTNKDTSDHSIIKSFINDLDKQHGDTIKEFMDERSLYDQLIAYFAVSYLLGDPDDLRGNYNNSYVYFTGDTNQIVIIPIDNDRVMGATGNGGNPTGHFATLTKPFDKRTGYSGDDNNSKFFNVTLFSSNSTIMPNDYLNKIQEVIDNGWMSYSKYYELFNIAKEHYQEYVNLSDHVSGPYLNFDINENDDIYGHGNLSIKKYLETKVDTFLKNK